MSDLSPQSESQAPAASAPSQASSDQPATNSAPASQTPGHPSFRRQRASRACETCHARKVRCDAASLGVPCTNCVAFSIECRIPVPKRKRANAARAKDEESEAGDSQQAATPSEPRPARPAQPKPTVGYNSPDGIPSTQMSEAQAAQQAANNSTMAQFMKPKFARAPIKEAGRVAYLGESSNLSLLVHDRHGTTDVVHYPLPENIRGARARLTEPDQMEIEILQQRGAFLLPPRALCDELVDAYFRWVAPIVPVINRSRFMKRYKDTKNPPSLLLLQAILLAGSRVCTNPQLMDATGSTTPAAMTFYKRAKALYDANYEDDRITIVQALILMGWYWEGPEGKASAATEFTDNPRSNIAADVTKNVFYWTRVAIVVAQGAGMHRSVESSQLSRQDKRLWKRVWWSLFTRDRSVAVALGRPVSINTDDSDVEMITEEDFIEDEGDPNNDYQADPVHIQFFLQYVKLCEIMGLVLSQQYSVASKARRTNAIDLTHSDMALADWLQNCPREVYWERSRHHFWSALLHSNYYTTLCLLHRAHMPPATAKPHDYENVDMAYPSRTIAFQAAGMITSIMENLLAHDQVKYTPAFILFSALIMHVYQMRSSVPSVVAASQERINVCMNALKEVSKVWLVAKMVHTLFESILGNKVLEERLQKATGKKAQRAKVNQRDQGQNHANGNSNGIGSATPAPAPPPVPPANPAKRKFDDIDLAFNVGPPAPQMSYERSRPQTPAVTPSRDIPQQPQHNFLASPPLQNEQYLPPSRSRGASRLPSRGPTRANSPFNGYSIPATPPDLFLVTRDSPNISQQLWENFQPDQLFPDGTIGDVIGLSTSPILNHAVDPQLQQLQGQQTGMSTGGQSMPHIDISGQGQQQSQVWPPGMQGMMGAGMELHDSDGWSTSSLGNAPVAPTTLNVEDWFQFFGINGEVAGMNMDGT
ncbi:Cutinase transcription factor 1 alpha [Fonsecaea pedrosoi]|nr:Cutinase transcription factor 1 alpha [Fonsecaea pedrosoi]